MSSNTKAALHENIDRSNQGCSLKASYDPTDHRKKVEKMSVYNVKIMVVFTCNQCGQSVKKNQVESHCYQCRNCQSLSCMDCGKEFWGDDYKIHTKCITEDEKYGGKGYQPKPSSNKGEVKQEKWIEHIKNVISTKKLSGPLSRILEQIVEYNNIPRKKFKFENFLKNSLKLRNPKLISEAWDIFAQSTANESAPSTPQAVNGVNNSLKRPLEVSEETPNKRPCLNGNESKVPSECSDEFKWVEVTERILQNAPSPVPISTLRKQVLSEYRATVKKTSLSKDELKRKFREVVSNSSIFVLSKNE